MIFKKIQKLIIKFFHFINIFNNNAFFQENDIIKTVEVKNGTKKTKNLDLLSKNTITAFHNIEIDLKNIEPEITLKDNFKKKKKKGDIVGTAKYKVDDLEYQTELIAGSDVEKSNIGMFLIISSIVILVLAMIIMPKKKGNRNKKYRYMVHNR